MTFTLILFELRLILSENAPRRAQERSLRICDEVRVYFVMEVGALLQISH